MPRGHSNKFTAKNTAIGPKAIKKSKKFRAHRKAAMGLAPPVGGAGQIMRPVLKAGRPSTYNDEVALAILERLANGESLRAICAEVGMPETTTVNAWCLKRPEFNELYERARSRQFDSWADIIKDASAQEREGTKTSEYTDAKGKSSGVQTTKYDNVERSRLEVSSLQWLLERLDHKRFGNRLQTSNRTELLVQIQKIECIIIDEASDKKSGLIEYAAETSDPSS